MELAQHLRAQIRAGDLAPGDRIPTETELCDEHGVSQGTVAKAMRVLSDEGLVIRKRRVGTIVADPRKRAAPDGVWSIYILGGDLRDMYHYPHSWFISDCMMRAVMTHNTRHLIRAPHPEDLKRDLAVDPNPVAFISVRDLYDVERNLIGDSPHVANVRERDRFASVNSVNLDQVTSAYRGVRYLIHDLGHQDIALIWGGRHHHRDNLQGYRLALSEAGIPFREQYVSDSQGGGEDHGAQALKQLLDAGARFKALFVDTDLKAIGAIKYLRKHGYRVPGDVAVLGSDDIPGVTTQFDLTTVRRPFSDMGTEALRLLEWRIRHNNRDVPSIVAYGEVIKRGTCLPAAQTQGISKSGGPAARKNS